MARWTRNPASRFAWPVALLALALVCALPGAAAGQAIPTKPDGTVGVDTALKAFAATVAPLPGVTPPMGGYPGLRSGSGPIRWVLANWKRLTPAQRAAVKKALPGLAVPGERRKVATGGGVHLRHGQRAGAAAFQLAEVEQIVTEAIPRLNAHFNPPLTLPVFVGTVDMRRIVARAFIGEDGACDVEFSPEGLEQDLQEVRQTALHELTHCWQGQFGGLDVAQPAWLTEGGATWVEGVTGLEWNGARYRSPGVDGQWRSYFRAYRAPLTAMSYNAVGFFAQVERSGGDVFRGLARAFALGDNATTGAYRVFVDNGRVGKRFKTTIAPSALRRSNLGPDWVADGPMIPSARIRYNPSTWKAEGRRTLVLSANAEGQAARRIQSGRGAQAVRLVVDTPRSAWGLVSFKGGQYQLQSGRTAFCARASCVCPNGRRLRPLGGNSFIALYAFRNLANVRLQSVPLAEGCKALR